MSDTLPFTLGITYRQRRSGHAMWQQFDHGAAREELAQIAALGIGSVRLPLTWAEFQPRADRVGSRAMQVLEQTLDMAGACGLQALPVLLPVADGGALQIPGWANGPDVLGQLRRARGGRATLMMRPPGAISVLAGERYVPIQCGDLFTDEDLLAAQLLLVREVAGYFGSHPAIWGWQIGAGLERATSPLQAADVTRWCTALTDTLHQVAPAARALGVVSRHGLSRAAGPHPADLGGCADLGVSVDPAEEQPAQVRRLTDPAAFLHALAAGLAGRAVHVIDAGLALATDGAPRGWGIVSAYGSTTAVYLADAVEQGEYTAALLDRLYAAGAAGIWLAGYADHPAETWRAAPLDRASGHRALGLVDAQGNEKPAAAAVRAFATRLASAPATRPAPPTLDAERHRHDAARETTRLWREFVAP